MMMLRPALWPLFAALASAALLAGAFAFEHLGGLPPCPLCIDQRWAHVWVVLAGLGLYALFRVAPASARFAWAGSLVLAALFAFSAFLAIQHAGAEYGWWAVPEGCAAAQGGANPSSTADLLASLGEARRIPRCDEIPWALAGVSMAGWNGLISAGLGLISVFVAVSSFRSAK